MRITDASESVRALAERRKCCDIIVSGVDAPNMMTNNPVVNGQNIEYDDLNTESGDGMATDIEWQNLVKGMLRAELKRRNVGYRELAVKLGEIGVQESERNIANKISRGGFTAVFFVQCLVAVGCHTLRLGEPADG
ncbi:DUF6471 domain-containing protein [Rhodopila sp.]|uniref:DUF6471 domain-containing protein n=1 Tax=Rhodopila sp. TaxID=2480087 RepID=UPI003D0B7EF8